MNLKALAAALAAVTVAGSALAADLPSRKVAPVMAPLPMLTWTGFYAGVNIGGVFEGSSSINLPALDTRPVAIANFGIQNSQLNGGYPTRAPFSSAGVIGGVQIGYNWQISSLVAGLEADLQATSLGKTTTAAAVSNQFFGLAVPTYFGAATVTSGLSYLGTVRGRLGVLATPTLLLYGTGGLAYGDTKLSYQGFGINPFGVPITGASSTSGLKLGWTVGAGGEWKFTQNWSAKLEYLYYDLGSRSTSFFACLASPPAVPGNCSIATASRRFNGHVVRVGLNYHFGGAAAPVVAKY